MDSAFIDKKIISIAQDGIDSGNFRIKDVNLKKIDAVSIGEVSMRNNGSDVVLYIDDKSDMYFMQRKPKKFSMKEWKEDIGGIFLKDYKFCVRRDLRKKTCTEEMRNTPLPEYSELTLPGTRILLKKIDEVKDAETLLTFGEKSMLRIADTLYLPMKVVEKKENYNAKSYVLDSLYTPEDEEEEEVKKKPFDDMLLADEDSDMEEKDDIYRYIYADYGD